MQHIIGGDRDDENRQFFNMRLSEILAASTEAQDPADDKEEAESIKDRIIAKGEALASGE